MPFARRKAYYLLGIGDTLGWATTQTFAHLPTGWSILYHLGKLDRRTLERLIQEKVIHPRLKLWEARRLAAQIRAGTVSAASRKGSVREWLRRSEDFVRAGLPDWSATERELAQTKLTRIIEQIGAAQSAVFNALRGTSTQPS